MAGLLVAVAAVAIGGLAATLGWATRLVGAEREACEELRQHLAGVHQRLGSAAGEFAEASNRAAGLRRRLAAGDGRDAAGTERLDH